MKKRVRSRCTVLGVVLLATVFLCGVTATAGVIDTSDVLIGGSPYRTFQDTTTNLVWLDLDNFFTSTATYNSVVALLSGSGFHIASLAELQVLQASIPAVPANFASEVPIVGGNYAGSPYATGTRNLMWGIYEDGNPSNGISYSWKYDTDALWNFTSDTVVPADTLRSQNEVEQDLGAWVVQDEAAIPEPGTVALLGLGLAGLAVLRLRKRIAS